MGSIPVIDLNLIGDETYLFKTVKHVLLRGDTFLLKNYADYQKLSRWISKLSKEEPDLEQKFDGDFVGVLERKNGTILEQYVNNTGTSWRFPRRSNSEALINLESKCKKIGVHFGQVCLLAIGLSSVFEFNDQRCSTVITRYYNCNSGSSLIPELEFDYFEEYEDYQGCGLLTVFPDAQGIQVYHCSKWIKILENDYILIHTGDLLARLSENKQIICPIRIPKDPRMVRVMLGPQMDFIIDKLTMGDYFFREQIELYPEISETYHPAKIAEIRLKKIIASLKSAYQISLLLLALYKMDHPTAEYASLHKLLPQISTTAKQRITEAEIYKICSIWDQAYMFRTTNQNDLEVDLTPFFLKETSTKIQQFNKLADDWLTCTIDTAESTLISDVPIKENIRNISFKDNKKSFIPQLRSIPNRNSGLLKKISNPDKKNIKTSDLLERIRFKEKKAAELLIEREHNYKEYLRIKMEHVLKILLNLEPGKPYTLSYLSSLIVDSLLDSNNPIGSNEVESILSQLQLMLPDIVSLIEVEGNLKVYKWTNMDKNRIRDRLKKQLINSL